MPDDTRHVTGGDLHRLLDEAFAGVEMTPESQDLKEEIRTNLVARVADLEAAGQSQSDAVRRAIAELGDVRAMLDTPAAADGSGPGGGAAPGAASGGAAVAWEAATHRNRVRPKATFVVGIVVAALVATIALALATLSATGVLSLPIGVTIALVGLTASGVAWIVGDSLSQETTTNHPVPPKRAAGYFLASFLAVYGLGVGGLIALGALPVWVVVFATLAAVAAIIAFSFLGATQTNRKKAWVRAMLRTQPAMSNRFVEEPESAARFGIYTAAIWIAAFAGFVVLSYTVGWAWSWLALLAGLLVTMMTLARMLFGPR